MWGARLEEVQELGAHHRAKIAEACDIRVRAHQVRDKAGEDGIGNLYEHDRNRPSCLLQRQRDRAANAQKDIGCECDEFGCERLHLISLGGDGAIVDLNIAAEPQTEPIERPR